MTEGTFDEMKPIMGNCAIVNPPLTFNKNNNGYAESDSMSNNDSNDPSASIQGSDEIDTEGSQYSKKKCKTSNGSNGLLVTLKEKWEKDREEEAII